MKISTTTVNFATSHVDMLSKKLEYVNLTDTAEQTATVNELKIQIISYFNI